MATSKETAGYDIVVLPVYDEFGKPVAYKRYVHHDNWGKEFKGVHIFEDDLPFINFAKLRDVLNSKDVIEELIDFLPKVILVEKRGSEKPKIIPCSEYHRLVKLIGLCF